MKSNNKLKGKDLINIGIYAAIYCVLMTCIAMLGYIPIMLPMLAVIGPIVLGVPMMLFYTKVKKFGMITIMGTIVGIYLCVTGMGFWPIVFGVVFGFLADLVAKSGKYASSKKTILSYGTFCVLLFGNFLPLYIDREAYFSTVKALVQNTSIHSVVLCSRGQHQPLLLPLLCAVCWVRFWARLC